MRLPKYWGKGHVEVEDRKGRRHKFSAWGWSDTSKQDAERKGKERAASLGRRILNGEQPMRYLYGTSPLREEVVRQFQDQDGKVHSAITINSYGCHVLNSSELMMVDVDLPETGQVELILHYLIKIVARNSMHPRQRREAAQLARVEEFSRLKPNLGIRVYRTHSGLRYLFTNHKMKPDSAEAARDMEFLNADPVYIKLCKMQECFRGRLTPKPWRCGLRTTSIRYPWENDRERKLYQSWNQEYMKLSGDFATCKYIGEYGQRSSTGVVAELLKVHDQLTKANMNLPLA
jgi:hypothetical protein